MNYPNHKIALIGIGILGESIAERLIAKGFKLGIWNRTKKKCDNLIKKGAHQILNLGNIPIQYEIIITVLKDGKCTRDTILNVFPIKNKLIIQMGTIGSEESFKLESFVKAKGGKYLEAPVLGSVKEALSGKLLGIIGGNKKDFERNEFIFKAICEKSYFLGSVSNASSSKLALNYLIAALTYSFSLSLRFLQENDINVEIFMDLLRNSSLYAKTFDKKLERMLSENHENANFNVKNLSKDIELFRNEVKKMNIDETLLEKLNDILKSKTAKKYNNYDYSSIYLLTKKSMITKAN